jgi:hypothetical protein
MINLDFKPGYKGLQGRDNMSGLRQRVLIADSTWFASIAKCDNIKETSTYDPTDMEGLVTISSPHTFVAGKGFIELYASRDSNSLTYEANEELDRTGGDLMVEAFYPGDEPEIIALLAEATVRNWIALVEPMQQSGFFYQLGQENLWAAVRGSFATGTLTGDRKGSTYMVSSYDRSLLFYRGVVTMMPVPTP